MLFGEREDENCGNPVIFGELDSPTLVGFVVLLLEGVRFVKALVLQIVHWSAGFKSRFVYKMPCEVARLLPVIWCLFLPFAACTFCVKGNATQVEILFMQLLWIFIGFCLHDQPFDSATLELFYISPTACFCLETFLYCDTNCALSLAEYNGQLIEMVVDLFLLKYLQFSLCSWSFFCLCQCHLGYTNLKSFLSIDEFAMVYVFTQEGVSTSAKVSRENPQLVLGLFLHHLVFG